MSNDYLPDLTPLAPGQLAQSIQVNERHESAVSAFDKLPAPAVGKKGFSGATPVGTPTETDHATTKEYVDAKHNQNLLDAQQASTEAQAAQSAAEGFAAAASGVEAGITTIAGAASDSAAASQLSAEASETSRAAAALIEAAVIAQGNAQDARVTLVGDEKIALAVAQAMLAEAWAEGSEPGGVGTKSAKEHAESIDLSSMVATSDFTGNAILAKLVAIGSVLAGLNAERVGGKTYSEILTLINARAASTHTHAAGDITGLSSGISFGGTQWTGYSAAPAAPGNAIVTGLQSVFDYGSGQTTYRVSYRTFTQ